jgi:hypothetical protein
MTAAAVVLLGVSGVLVQRFLCIVALGRVALARAYRRPLGVDRRG